MKVSHLRTAASGALALALFAGQGAAFGVGPSATDYTHPAVSENLAADAPLRDLIVDQLGTIHQGTDANSPALGFTPDVTAYSATAYYHRKTVTVYPIAASGAQVSVEAGGKALKANKDGRYTVTLQAGSNVVTVKATSGSTTKTYTLTINKVNTDFRGNVLVSGMKATANREAAKGYPIENILDSSRWTQWHEAQAPVAATDPQGTDGTGFTLELPEVRDVVRLNVYGSTTPNKTWYPNEFETNATISVSLDGKTWTTAMEGAALRQDQNVLYWDLGGSHKAKYVRVTLAHLHTPTDKAPALTEWSIGTLELWARPLGAPAEEAPAANAQSVKDKCSDSETAKYGDVNRAQKLVLCQGLLFSTWVPSEKMAHDVPTNTENQILGGLSPMFYDRPLFNEHLMQTLPANTPWGIAKAPAGANGIGAAGEPQEFLTDEMKPYASNLADLQYGDEGSYSKDEVESFRKWFEFSKAQYPQALVHSNQFDDASWGNLENYRNYVKTAKPDVASWDTYYWGGGGVFGSHQYAADNQTAGILNVGMWKTQRQASLEGITGDGSQPIVYGQYLDMFDFNGSESQKSLVTNLGLTTGQKFFSFFRLEYNGFDGGAMVDDDGAPLRGAYEYGDVVTRARNLAKFLLPLNNQWVATVPGQTKSGDATTTNNVATGYKMDSFANSAAANKEYGIANVSVENIGTTNNGLPGDVVLGYFKTLPGLSGTYAKDVFGSETPRGIMVTNGMTGHTEHGQTSTQRPATMPFYTRYDDGQHWQAAQRVTIELAANATGTLKSVDPATGKVSTVTPETKDGKRYVSIAIGGGQSAFLYWEKAPVFTSISSNSTIVNVGKTVRVKVKITNPGTSPLTNFAIKTPEIQGLTLKPTADVPTEIPAGQTVEIAYDLSSSEPFQTASLNFDMTWDGGNARETVPLGAACADQYTPKATAADSEETTQSTSGFKKATDRIRFTEWHTAISPVAEFGTDGHWIVVNAPAKPALGDNSICGINITPSQESADGRAKDYAVYSSMDGKNWSEKPIAEGTLLNIGATQTIPFPQTRAPYIKFVAKNNYSTGEASAYLAISEISLNIGKTETSTWVPTDIPTVAAPTSGWVPTDIPTVVAPTSEWVPTDIPTVAAPTSGWVPTDIPTVVAPTSEWVPTDIPVIEQSQAPVESSAPASAAPTSATVTTPATQAPTAAASTTAPAPAPTVNGTKSTAASSKAKSNLARTGADFAGVSILALALIAAGAIVAVRFRNKQSAK